jgi:WAS/WASL-interacting protein
MPSRPFGNAPPTPGGAPLPPPPPPPGAPNIGRPTPPSFKAPSVPTPQNNSYKPSAPTPLMGLRSSPATYNQQQVPLTEGGGRYTFRPTSDLPQPRSVQISRHVYPSGESKGNGKFFIIHCVDRVLIYIFLIAFPLDLSKLR